MSIIGCKMTEYMIKLRDHNYFSIFNNINKLEKGEAKDQVQYNTSL